MPFRGPLLCSCRAPLVRKGEGSPYVILLTRRALKITDPGCVRWTATSAPACRIGNLVTHRAEWEAPGVSPIHVHARSGFPVGSPYFRHTDGRSPGTSSRIRNRSDQNGSCFGQRARHLCTARKTNGKEACRRACPGNAGEIETFSVDCTGGPTVDAL